MKKIFLFFFLLNSLPAFAKNDFEDFQKANDFYSEKEYNSAIDLYESIILGGGKSAELFYNLGNAYFRTGKIGCAILNYEKALRISPDDEDIKYNLKVASARNADKIEALPKVFVLSWADNFSHLLSINSWAVLIYISFIALLVSAYLLLFSKRSDLQKKYFYSAATTLIVIVISLLIVGRIYYLNSNFTYAIITESDVTAKSSPDSTSSDVFVIHEGLKIELLDSVEEWRKIKLPDGKVGWITNSEMGVIKI